MSIRLFQFRTRAPLALAASALMVLAGCDSTPAPKPADPNAARQTLERTLTSWQKGEKLESLKNAKPSVTVSDLKWGRGDKLTKFELDGPSKPSGAQQAFRVTLWLVNEKGAESKESVQYEVGTDPVHTVFRTMFE